ncbi:hypothetical protein PG993_000331 [Apiospora rasikravindrae]|uniref:Uncharacterized protein n=1 Tax=Apiospora rasikravindrae TaxID=990691 RepID=A0ABR1U8B2_9PEZI
MAKARLVAIGAIFATLLAPALSAGPVEARQTGCARDNLLRALLNPTRTAEVTSFCNDYLCRAYFTVTATTAGSAHPLYLYNLQPSVLGSGTPLSYPSPPTPSTIPGNAACYAWPAGVSCPYPPTRKRSPDPVAPAPAVQARQAVADCPAPTVPSFLMTATTSYPASRLSSACSCLVGSAPLPTTTSTCTAIGESAAWPQTTIPAFCQPSFHVNRASLLPLPGVTSTAVVTLGLVSDKLDCCVSCAGIYNCVAWSYVPFPSPTAAAVSTGGSSSSSNKDNINPWISGMCVAAYNYGIIPTNSNNNGNAAAVCPNGVVGEALGGGTRNPSGDGGLRWENLYYNGWNEGPCGRPLNVFQSGTDGGRGDYDSLCQ